MSTPPDKKKVKSNSKQAQPNLSFADSSKKPKQTSMLDFFKRKTDNNQESVSNPSTTCSVSHVSTPKTSFIDSTIHSVSPGSTTVASDATAKVQCLPTINYDNQSYSFDKMTANPVTQKIVAKTSIIDTATIYIDSQNTDDIETSVFKTLCFYDVCLRQNKEFFICKLNHNNDSVGCFEACGCLKNVCLKMQAHLRHLHKILAKELKHMKSYQIDDKTSISFDAIPPKTLQLFRKLQAVSLNKVVKKNQDEMKQSNLPIALLYIPKKYNRLNVTSEAIVELTAISMFHYSFIKQVNFPELFNDQLREGDHIKHELCNLKLKTTKSANVQKLLTETSYSVYFGFSSLASKSIYDVADVTNYGGCTSNLENRLQNHKTDILNVLSSRRNNQLFHIHMAACIFNDKPIFIEPFRDTMNKIEALFTEYTIIAFFRVSPINQNADHGSTSEFKNELKDVKKRNGKPVTSEDIVKCGCAEFVRFYMQNQFDFETLSPVFKKQPPVSTNLSFDPQAYICSATEKAIEAKIPMFLLTDLDNSFLAAYNYAIHLCTSLFDIRAKIMMWYLLSENSLNRLDNLPITDKLEFFDSINSVLADRPGNLTDCVKLSKNLCHRLFITNVEDATRVLFEMGQKERLYPLKTINSLTAQKFIAASSMLYATMYDIKDDEDHTPTENVVNKLISQTSYSLPKSTLVEGKKYKKPEKFIDLVHFQHQMTPETISLRYPEKLTAMAIQPIAPFIDNPHIEQFIDSTIRLRCFNFNNKFPNFIDLNSQIFSINRDKFELPYFRWSHKFNQLL